MMTVDRIGVFLMASNLRILLCLGCSERGTPRICCVKWRRGGRGRWGGRGEAGRWRGRRTRGQPHAAYQSSLATTTHWKLLRIHWDDCEDQTERHAARTKGVGFGSLLISSTSLQLFHSFESLCDIASHCGLLHLAPLCQKAETHLHIAVCLRSRLFEVLAV